ncbi:hypothetical protein [Ornithinibacillus sp. JPR2-1]|uniref:hypothetical protein n=1 Tax=Ornithinibacillus sp. JPR2-1 TaxID=2094019 RepID=UPI0031D2510A
MEYQLSLTDKEEVYINKRLKSMDEKVKKTEDQVSAMFVDCGLPLIREVWLEGIRKSPEAYSFKERLFHGLINLWQTKKLKKNTMETIYQKIESLSEYQALTLIKVAMRRGAK